MIVDLTVPLNEQTPVYPGDKETKIEKAGMLEKDGFCDYHFSVGTHVGTHIDGPMHMVEGGKGINEYDASSFTGNGVYIDATDGDFSSVKQADIRVGDIVLIHTGMAEKYHDDAYYKDYPIMSEEIARYLVSKEVKMVGLDACSVDKGDDFPLHRILLGAGILLIENLTGLQQLKDKKFDVYALPIKLEADSAPARVVAKIS